MVFAAAAAAFLLLASSAQVHAGGAKRSLDNVAGESSGLKVNLPVGKQTCQGDWCDITGEYVHSDALFGIPPYGGDKHLTGQIHYVTRGEDETGCDANYDPFKYIKPNESKGSMIFLIDRGVCNFVEKVRIAEEKGAMAVIVADNTCLCKEKFTKTTDKFAALCDASITKYNEGTCETILPFMSDDGSGGDINIPSYLVSLFDGQRLKDCIQTADGTVSAEESTTGVVCASNAPVISSLHWDMPSNNGNVEWSLWTNADAQQVFKRKFKDTALALAGSTTFTPRYFVHDGVYAWRCAGTDACGSLCTHNGRYCNPDPDSDTMVGVSGADVVMENLRQMCVWKQANKTYASDGGKKWWEYAEAFDIQCHGKDVASPDTFNEECSRRVHGTVGLSWEATQKCISDAETTNANGDKINTLLEEAVELRSKLAILDLPTVVVNGVLERGTVSPVAVLSTICSGFKTDTEPDLCSCVENHATEDVMKCSQQIKCTESTKPFFCNLNNRCYASAAECTKCSSTTKPYLCPKDNKCYETTDVCSDNCEPGEFYCKSDRKCYSDRSNCPVCSATEPFYCQEGGKCVGRLEDCVQDVVESHGMSGGTVVVIVLIVAGVLGGGFFLYWKRARDQMRSEVRNILAEYMPMDDVGNVGAGSERLGLI